MNFPKSPLPSWATVAASLVLHQSARSASLLRNKTPWRRPLLVVQSLQSLASLEARGPTKRILKILLTSKVISCGYHPAKKSLTCMLVLYITKSHWSSILTFFDSIRCICSRATDVFILTSSFWTALIMTVTLSNSSLIVISFAKVTPIGS